MVQASFTSTWSTGGHEIQITPAAQGEAVEVIRLNLTRTFLGTSKKLGDGQITVDASMEKIAASKKLLQSDELKAIKSIDSEMTQYVKSRSIPSCYKAGIYLIKLDSVVAVDQALQDFQARRANAVDTFVSRYSDIQWQDSLPADQGGLGGCYDPSDYPSTDKVRASFSMRWNYEQASTPGKIADFSVSIYERCQAQAQAEMQEAIEQGKALLRAEFAGLIAHLHERLTPGADGQPKKFKAATLGNAIEFLRNFTYRDIAIDNELRPMLQAAADMLGGVTPDDLRNDATMRAHIASQAAAIKASLDPLIVKGPSRAISLESNDWDL